MWPLREKILIWWILFLLTHPVWDVTVTFLFIPANLLFLLTHPVWDVTGVWPCIGVRQCISTHTSRVGCDMYRCQSCQTFWYFYSHIPCGMWHGCGDCCFLFKNFYSHIPCGMWPAVTRDLKIDAVFLLTHPVWDVTPVPTTSGNPQKYFYSHIPCGMWQRRHHLEIELKHFYSHIPCGMWQYTLICVFAHF